MRESQLSGRLPLEPRLQRRHQQLVQENLQIGQSIAAGFNALPGTASALASTQAAWRFYKNENVTLPALVQPLLEQARSAASSACDQYGLVLHDWSHLNYDRHTGKADRIGSKPHRTQGYELQTALLVSDRDGAPLAPVCQNLVCQEGLHTTRSERLLPTPTHLDELAGRMEHLAGLSLGRPLIHLIDREGDSVGHYRQWEKDHHFLVRAKGGSRVEWEGQNSLLATVATQLRQSQGLVFCRAVKFQGRAAQQYVAETAVVLRRRSRQKRRGKKPQSVAGKPLPLRLVVSEVRAESGKVLAVWMLLSNAPAGVGAGQLALWYYWRWRIESFFKLLKGAGQQLEHWQQESGLAVAKRLLVASMGCVLIWQLERNASPAAAELRVVLVRLSGRQMKRDRPWTAPALLEGVWVLLAMLELLDRYDLSKLQQLAQEFFQPNP